jgi:hypothetical protein
MREYFSVRMSAYSGVGMERVLRCKNGGECSGWVGGELVPSK